MIDNIEDVLTSVYEGFTTASTRTLMRPSALYRKSTVGSKIIVDQQMLSAMHIMKMGMVARSNEDKAQYQIETISFLVGFCSAKDKKRGIPRMLAAMIRDFEGTEPVEEFDETRVRELDVALGKLLSDEAMESFTTATSSHEKHLEDPEGDLKLLISWNLGQRVYEYTQQVSGLDAGLAELFRKEGGK